MSAQKYLSLVASGIHTLYTAITSSAGVSDANKIIATNAQGDIDATFFPDGFAPAVQIVQTTEALVAGDFVNLYNVTGSPRARKASSTAGLPASGFVLTAAASGANATVWLEGPNTALTGLTPGTLYFLGASGAASAAAPAQTAGVITQELGTTNGAASLWFTRQHYVVAA